LSLYVVLKNVEETALSGRSMFSAARNMNMNIMLKTKAIIPSLINVKNGP